MKNCGVCKTPLVLSFTKKGTRVLVCQNIECRVSTFGIGKLQQLEIWCDMVITDPSKQPIKQLTKHEEQAVDRSIQHDGLKAGFDKLVGDKMLMELEQSTFSTINQNELIAQANLAIMLEIPVFQIPELFNACFKLAHALGLKPEHALTSISKGIGRHSKKILDNIGVVFDARTAYEFYQKMYNLEKLTQAQKNEAWKQYAIELVIKKAHSVPTPTQDQLKRAIAETQQENGQIEFGEKLRG